jgi:ComF family protein
MLQKGKLYVTNLLNLVFPKVCIYCVKNLYAGEEFLCVACTKDLPLVPWNKGDCFPVSNQLKGKANFIYTYSLYYYFKAGKTGKLIKEIKYRSNKELGISLGRRFGERLKENPTIKEIDFIVPVPLHPRRMLKRGYNQAELIAVGMSEILSIPVKNNTFKRVKYSSSQTKKGREGRANSSQGIFEMVDSPLLEGKHLLIIDDVITTGATMESMFSAVNLPSNVKISVAALCSPYE